MRTYDFCHIRLQVLKILRSSKEIKRCHKHFVDVLVGELLHGTTGTYGSTDKGLAERFEVSVSTISRTVQALQSSGLFKIKRGSQGRMTEYAISETVLLAAVEARSARDIGLTKQPGKDAIHSPAKVRVSTQQKCGALKKGKNKDNASPQAKAPSGKYRDIGGIGYHSTGDYAATQLDQTNDTLGYKLKITDFPSEIVDGDVRFLIPNWGIPERTGPQQDAFIDSYQSFLREYGVKRRKK